MDSTPSPPLEGGEGRGEEGLCGRTKTPLSPTLSPLVPRGEREPASNSVKLLSFHSCVQLAVDKAVLVSVIGRNQKEFQVMKLMKLHPLFPLPAKSLGLFAATVVFSTAALGNSITVGLPATGFNVIPFARLPGAADAATRYQQAYSANDFTGLGTLNIGSVSFQGGNGGNFAPGTYNISFSPITAGIDTLSNTAFDANLGPDQALFTSAYLSGASPDNLIFTGSPFFYDPAAGNLLLDIRITQDGAQPDGAIAAYAINGSASGVFSRYDNFGTGTLGIGLVTTFGFDTVPDAANSALLLAAAIGVTRLCRKPVVAGR